MITNPSPATTVDLDRTLGCLAGCTSAHAVVGCPEHWALPTPAPTWRRFRLPVDDRPLAGTVYEALDAEARDYDPREEW